MDFWMNLWRKFQESNDPAHMEEDAFGMHAYEVKSDNLIKLNT